MSLVEFDDTGYSPDLSYTHNCEGVLETYGQDLEEVMKIKKTSPKRLWTILDSESSNDLIIVAGYHLINRVMYYVTNEEWKTPDEEYIWQKSFEDNDDQLNV